MSRSLPTVLTALILGCSNGGAFKPLAIGDPAPRVALRVLDGDSVQVGAGAAILLVNIWATWCIPCRAEFPDLQALHQTYADRGVTVLAVSVDQGRDGPVRDFVTKAGATFKIGRDPSGETQARYQTVGVPESFLIGRDGKIAWRKIGALQPGARDARTAIDRLLAASDRPR